MKPFLLIAGYGYYPSAGTEDWRDTYSTHEEAEATVFQIVHNDLYIKGPKKGQIKNTTYSYKIVDSKGESTVDWYEIVNLQEWMNR